MSVLGWLFGVVCPLIPFLWASGYLVRYLRQVWNWKPSPLADWLRFRLDLLVPLAGIGIALVDPDGHLRLHWVYILCAVTGVAAWWWLNYADREINRDDDDDDGGEVDRLRGLSR